MQGLRLKSLLPKGLFARTLIIFIAPITLMQLIVLWLFFDVHWQRTSQNQAFNVAVEIALLADLVEDLGPSDQAMLQRLAGERKLAWLSWKPEVRPPQSASLLPAKQNSNIPTNEDRVFVAALQKQLRVPVHYVADLASKRSVIEFSRASGRFRFEVDRSRAVPTRSYQFFNAVLIATLMSTLVSLLFIRNQIRPILQLAQAAESFGRGRDMVDFHPWGAREIRKAGYALIDMRDRLARFVSQRTQTLAAVSHDLRTPLTRLKLAVSLLPASPDRESIKEDLVIMGRMLDSYLDFARDEVLDQNEDIEIGALVAAIAAARAHQSGKFEVELDGPLTFHGKREKLRRILENLLDNALAHADQVRLSASQANGQLHIFIDDNGPGIAEHLRIDAFKPFTRLDPARSQNIAGTGLGLAIARDLARSHGGEVSLHHSPLGGLRAEVMLPI